MRRKRTKQTFKLQLLALVLALALVWYSLNPAPRSVIRSRKKAKPPEKKKLNVAPQHVPTTFPVVFGSTGGAAELSLSPDEDEDDFTWPEFIDG